MLAEPEAVEAGQAVLRLGFWAADWTPWRALTALAADWPQLRFVTRLLYEQAA